MVYKFNLLQTKLDLPCDTDEFLVHALFAPCVIFFLKELKL